MPHYLMPHSSHQLTAKTLSKAVLVKSSFKQIFVE